MNYVSEQNMQEILDGIARKIGQGGGSGAGLEDWQASYEYAENDICVYNGQIYKAIVGFESDITFSTTQILESYTLQSGDVPIAYTQGTDISIDDIVSYDGNYYKALYDFTCGDTFGLYALEEYTPKELTKAQEDSIVQDWIDNLGGGSSGGSGIIKHVLYEGTDQITDLGSTKLYNLSNSLDNYDFIVVNIISYEDDGGGNTEFLNLDVPIYKPYANRLIDSNIYNFLYKSQPSGGSYFCGWIGLDTTNNIIYFAPRDKVSFISYIYLASVTGYKFKSDGGSSSNNYSTTEQVIGTWIDGKPLYQITVIIESQANDTEEYTFSNLGIINISKTIKIDAITSMGIPNNAFWSSSNMLRVRRKSNGIEVYAPEQKADFPLYITLQYTKTTD